VIERVTPGAGLQALILTPTRELAEQVTNALRGFSFQKKLKIISVYGGVAIGPQIHDLAWADVVVATPGRLLDHLDRRTINLSKVKLLVLDEADRMLDMGFIDDVEKIIRICPKNRQTLFFSATISGKIRDLGQRYMNNPIKVSATKLVDPSKLKQVYYDVPRNMKLSLLVYLLKKENADLVMVFCNTRNNTDFVVKNLKANQIRAIAIHGGLSQNKRTNTIQSFNDAKVRVLVCTDVAARGLHIDNVSHVYNYDLPADSKDYVHRIGRTARAGEKGKVINLLCDADYDNFSKIQRDYRTFAIQRMEKPTVARVIAVRAEIRRGGFQGHRGPPQRGNFSRGGPRGNSRGFQRENRSRPSRPGNSQFRRNGNFKRQNR
jgi:ATP-dependent RNA helicase DeaD